MIEKLKPCPFCGSETAPTVCTLLEANEGIVEEGEDGYRFMTTHYEVVCDILNHGCGAESGMKLYCNKPETAIKYWNRRAEPTREETFKGIARIMAKKDWNRMEQEDE